MLPGLLFQTPLPAIKILPPIVILVPSTVTVKAVEMLVPPLVAVLPVNVTLGLVPSSVKPPVPTEMAPPTS